MSSGCYEDWRFARELLSVLADAVISSSSWVIWHGTEVSGCRARWLYTHFLVGERNLDGKLGTLSWLARDLDIPSVFLDNTVTHGQSKSRPISLCREKRLKDPGHILRWDTASGVPNLDSQPL